MNPYLRLGLSPSATDAEIRQRYLELIRKHPPEAQDGQFAQISEAYEKIKTPKARINWELFDLSSPATSLPELLSQWHHHKPLKPLSFERMSRYLNLFSK
jgi:curved DNA-binding protein CbpA